MNIFLYESICAGALGPQAPPSLRAEGWAMLAALYEDFSRLANIAVFTLLDREIGRPLGENCRRIAGDDEPTAFREMLGQADVVLVIAPEFDGHLLKRTSWVMDAGKFLLGSGLESIRLTGDKLALARHFAGRGVKSPPTYLLETSAFAEQKKGPYPAVCKPRHGAGAQATFRIGSEAECAAVWQQARQELPGTDFLLQPFVCGQPVSVSFLAGPNQCLPLPPAAQHLSIDRRFQYRGGQVPLAEPLAKRAVGLAGQAVAAVEGLAGFVGVDLVLGMPADGSEDWVIEINPRPTTSYIGLRQLASDNLVDAALRIARGEVIMPLHWRETVIEFAV